MTKNQEPHEKQGSQPEQTPQPRAGDFQERHGSSDKRPLPQRSGDMDRPGMGSDSDVE